MNQFKLLGVVIGFTILAGCGGPSLLKVTGKVTYQGKPVEGASVTFVSVKEEGFPASAVTDAQGNFTLETYWSASGKKLTGAQPGSYVATVTKTAKVSQEEMGAVKERRAVQRKILVPLKYASTKTSPLNYEVKPGSQEFKLELED